MARPLWIEFSGAECMIARPDPFLMLTLPVFLQARPVSFPKATAPFGIAGIHDFSRGTLFDFKRLDNSQAFNNKRNYYIII
jgi:hypothetical protein